MILSVVIACCWLQACTACTCVMLLGLSCRSLSPVVSVVATLPYWPYMCLYHNLFFSFNHVPSTLNHQPCNRHAL